MSFRIARIKKLFRIICDSHSIRNSEMNISSYSLQKLKLIKVIELSSFSDRFSFIWYECSSHHFKCCFNQIL